MYTQIKTGVSANTPTPEKTNVQRVNDKQRRQASTRILTALSGKQKEPNRGQGSERHPASPRAHVTGPNEETVMFSNIDEGVKDKISPHDAGEILDAHGGRDADFHALSGDHVHGLLSHAKKVGYHKSAHAPGSRARMFHQFLKRHAAKIHEVVETGVVFFEGEDFSEIPLAHRNEFAKVYAKKYNDHIKRNPHPQAHQKATHGAYQHIVNKYGEDASRALLHFHEAERAKRIHEGSIDETSRSEYNANLQLSSSNQSRKPGHYLMKHGRALHREPHTAQGALDAYKKIRDTTGISIHHVKENSEVVPGSVKTLSELKKSTLGRYITRSSHDMAHRAMSVGETPLNKDASPHIRKAGLRAVGLSRAVSRLTKEDAPGMSAGGAGDPGHVQNASDNYASQLANRKKNIKNMIRRKKPVGESVLSGHVPPEVAGVTVGVASPEELKKNKDLARLPKKVGPGGVDQE